MQHIQFDDVSVDYDVVGTGDQVALLHARPFVCWYEPLVAALPGYSLLRYRRTLAPDRSDFGLGDDADVCARLLRHVGFDHPHVVGHSYGGCLALELARRQTVALRSIALLEPATIGLLDPDEAIAAATPLMELYRSRAQQSPPKSSSGSSSATTRAASSIGSFRPPSMTPSRTATNSSVSNSPPSRTGASDGMTLHASTDRLSTCSARRVPPGSCKLPRSSRPCFRRQAGTCSPALAIC